MPSLCIHCVQQISFLRSYQSVHVSILFKLCWCTTLVSLISSFRHCSYFVFLSLNRFTFTQITLIRLTLPFCNCFSTPCTASSWNKNFQLRLSVKVAHTPRVTTAVVTCPYISLRQEVLLWSDKKNQNREVPQKPLFWCCPAMSLARWDRAIVAPCRVYGCFARLVWISARFTDAAREACEWINTIILSDPFCHDTEAIQLSVNLAVPTRLSQNNKWALKLSYNANVSQTSNQLLICALNCVFSLRPAVLEIFSLTASKRMTNF